MFDSDISNTLTEIMKDIRGESDKNKNLKKFLKRLTISGIGIIAIFSAESLYHSINTHNKQHKISSSKEININYNLKDYFNELYQEPINYDLQRNPQADNLKLKLLQEKYS